MLSLVGSLVAQFVGFACCVGMYLGCFLGGGGCLSLVPLPGSFDRVWVWLLPGSGLLSLICAVFQVVVCFGLCPFPIILGEVLSDFRLLWWHLASCIVLDCLFGLCPFWK